MTTIEARNSTLAFQVWAERKTFAEEAPASHCVAAFRFWLEALDFADYAVQRGARVVLRGPGTVSIWAPKEVTP